MATKKTSPSTALALKASSNSNIVDIRAQLAAQVAELAERTAPATGASIRVTQDKKFKFPNGEETTEAWSAIIVDYTAIRKYYPGAYDPNNITPPACFAISRKPKGMVPSPNSPELQNPAENGGCDTCPQNQWGSSGNGKACKEGRKLAVLPPADANEVVADLPMWTLEVSPTAVKPFDGYVNSVAKTFQLPPVGVITDVSFDTASSYASVRCGHPTPNQDLAAYVARQAEAQEILAVEPDVASYGQEAPKPAARGRAAPAKRPTVRR